MPESGERRKGEEEEKRNVRKREGRCWRIEGTKRRKREDEGKRDVRKTLEKGGKGRRKVKGM